MTKLEGSAGAKATSPPQGALQGPGGRSPWPIFTLVLPSLAACSPHNDGTWGFRLPCMSWECFHPSGGCQGGPPAFVVFLPFHPQRGAGPRAGTTTLGGNMGSGVQRQRVKVQNLRLVAPPGFVGLSLLLAATTVLQGGGLLLLWPAGRGCGAAGSPHAGGRAARLPAPLLEASAAISSRLCVCQCLRPPGWGKGIAVLWRCCPSAPLTPGPGVWSGRAEPGPGTPLLL